MKMFSKRFQYALAALSKLAGNAGKKPLHVADIAGTNDIPEKYLVQILIELRKGGFVESIRGTNGGYVLGRDPKEIRIVDVMETLDGEITAFEEPTRFRELVVFGKEIESKIKRILEISLEEIMNQKPAMSFDI
jgi:Rrf2 family protein